MENAPRISNTDFLNYTPVTFETFAVWCKDFMAKQVILEDQLKSEQDKRKTGKQLFMENQDAFEDLTLDEEDAAEIINSGAAAYEESKTEENPDDYGNEDESPNVEGEQ